MLEKLTQERLKEFFNYNEETGILERIKKNSKRSKIGDNGYLNTNGYLRICIDRKTYLVHRLVWLFMYGYFPSEQIDHINNVKTDNRISNLRCATAAQNQYNKKIQKNNTSGIKGVSFIKRPKKWKAAITIDGNYFYIGLFSTKEMAADAYSDIAKKNHGNFFNHDRGQTR